MSSFANALGAQQAALNQQSGLGNNTGLGNLGSQSGLQISCNSQIIWNSNVTYTVTMSNGVVDYYPLSQERHSQITERLLEQQRQEQLIEQAVERRAKELLESCLSFQQLSDFLIHRRFDVKGSLGVHTYRIDNVGNVRRLNIEGRSDISYCIHPDRYRHPVPTYDLILAKKLMIETDETLFLDTANGTDLNTGLLIQRINRPARAA